MIIGILCMFGVVVLWGITPTFIKIALHSFSPFTVAFLRLFLGVLVLCIVRSVRKEWRGGRVFRKDRRLLIGGIGVSINYAFFCLSLSYTTAGAGGLVVQVQFVVLAILAAVILKEHFRPLKIVGILMVISGIVLVLAVRGDLRTAFAPRFRFGNLLMLISGTGWAIYALSNKITSPHYSKYEILIPMLFVGVLVNGTAALISGNPITTLAIKPVLAVLVLGIFSTGLGFVLIDTGMRRLSAGLAGTITGVTPLFNLILAHLILGEPLLPLFIVSGILIATGLAGIVRAEKIPPGGSR